MHPSRLILSLLLTALAMSMALPSSAATSAPAGSRVLVTSRLDGRMLRGTLEVAGTDSLRIREAHRAAPRSIAIADVATLSYASGMRSSTRKGAAFGVAAGGALGAAAGLLVHAATGPDEEGGNSGGGEDDDDRDLRRAAGAAGTTLAPQRQASLGFEMAAGAVIGGLVGGIVGRLTGLRMQEEVWTDVPVRPAGAWMPRRAHGPTLAMRVPLWRW